MRRTNAVQRPVNALRARSGARLHAIEAVPYFFLDVGSWGLARVLLNCSWFAAGFLVVGLVLIGLDRVKPRT